MQRHTNAMEQKKKVYFLNSLLFTNSQPIYINPQSKVSQKNKYCPSDCHLIFGFIAVETK